MTSIVVEPTPVMITHTELKVMFSELRQPCDGRITIAESLKTKIYEVDRETKYRLISIIGCNRMRIFTIIIRLVWACMLILTPIIADCWLTSCCSLLFQPLAIQVVKQDSTALALIFVLVCFGLRLFILQYSKNLSYYSWIQV